MQRSLTSGASSYLPSGRSEITVDLTGHADQTPVSERLLQLEDRLHAGAVDGHDQLDLLRLQRLDDFRSGLIAYKGACRKRDRPPSLPGTDASPP